MRILVLCNKPPYPPRDGGAAASLSLIDGLVRAGHQLGVLAVNDPKYHVSPEDVPASFKEKLLSFRMVNVDLSIRPIPALISIAGKRSYHVSRFVSKRFRQALEEELKTPYDIIQFETIYPAVYHETARSLSNAVLVLRAHNIEHHIWEQLASNEKKPVKRIILKELVKTLRDYELDLFGKMDGILAITNQDRAFIECAAPTTPVHTVPFGLDSGQYLPSPVSGSGPGIFHIGSMDWIPNQEGIRWFLEKVWPELRRKRPSVHLVLAGRNMPPWLSAFDSPGLTIAGEVPDAREFIAAQGIMIAPLFSGSGVRIKILEGMLAAKPVVATSKALEGIDCKPGEHVLAADNPGDFLQAILKCIDDIEFSRNIGLNAREYVKANHDGLRIIRDLEGFYHRIMSEP